MREAALHRAASLCIFFILESKTFMQQETQQNKQSERVSIGEILPGDTILATKWIALDGTARLAHRMEQELCAYFPSWLIRDAKSFEQLLSVEAEAAIAAAWGVHAMYPAQRGGIFGSLWEFARESDVGMEISLSKLPLRQETVEVCNFLDVNPYQLHAGGCLLLATETPHGLVQQLENAQIPVAIIGTAEKGKDRIVRTKEGKRFLEPPRREEWECFLARTEG